MQAALILLEGEHTEPKPFPCISGPRGTTQSFEDVAQGNAESEGSDKLVLNKGAEEDPRDAKFLRRGGRGEGMRKRNVR